MITVTVNFDNAAAAADFLTRAASFDACDMATQHRDGYNSALKAVAEGTAPAAAAAPAPAPVKPKAEKPAAVKPAATPAPAPAAAAPSAAPTPAPASAPKADAVDYPTLQKAVFKLAGISRDAVVEVAGEFGLTTFKDSSSEIWGAALAAVNAKIDSLAVMA